MKYLLKIFLFFLCINLFAQTKSKIPRQPPKLNIDIVSKIELNNQIIEPFFYDNKIFTTEISGIISCFDIKGEKLWFHKFANEISVTPIIADKMITAATHNNDIVSLNIENGLQLQAIGISDSVTTGLTAIQYTGSKELMIPKTGNSNTAIIFGTASGHLICYDLETLQEYWRNSDAKGMITSKLIVVNNKILFTSKDGFLYCIDARNGLLIWRWKEKEQTDFSKAIILCDGKKIFVVDNGNSLFSIDLLIGNLNWKSNYKVLAVIGFSADKKKILAKGLDKKFYFISASNGKATKEVKSTIDFTYDKISPFETKKNIIYANLNSILVMNSRYKTDELFNSGKVQIISFQQIAVDKFLIASSDGTIEVIKVKLN